MPILANVQMVTPAPPAKQSSTTVILILAKTMPFASILLVISAVIVCQIMLER